MNTLGWGLRWLLQFTHVRVPTGWEGNRHKALSTAVVVSSYVQDSFLF